MNKPPQTMHSRFTVTILGLLLLAGSLATAAPQGGTLSAAELATRLRAKQEGSSYIRVRMENTGAKPEVLQLQIKSRVSGANADIVYQVLFPKERKGEAVLLHRSNDRMSGTHFIPPDTFQSLDGAQFEQPLFGSALTYVDVIEDVFGWPQQAIAGTEVIDRTECQILESKPGGAHRSSYARVRAWVDGSRLVPLRIEKLDNNGKLVRKIDVTRIQKDGEDSVPANLVVRGPGGAITKLDGSKINRGVSFSPEEFTPEGLKQLKMPQSAHE